MHTITTPANFALGFGVGLRSQHFADVLQHWPQTIDWFEVITENVLDNYGWARHVLEQIRQHYPIGLHGVSLSIGSTDPLDTNYVRRLKTLCDDIEPSLVSDHLCWTSFAGHNTHDLLPLPLTPACLEHVAERVCQVQDILQRPLLLENPSSYLEYTESSLTEWAFLHELTQRTGCYLLLDVNNVYVSARNHGFDPSDYLAGLPDDRIAQIHLAGHDDHGHYVIDTHDRAVCAAVWQLYQQAIQRFGPTTTLLEWDANIPPFATMVSELDKARQMAKQLDYRKPNRPLPLSTEYPPSQWVMPSNRQGNHQAVSNPVSFLYGVNRQ